MAGGEGAVRPPRGIRVAIFVDSIDPKRRRYTYWLRYFRRRGLKPELVSIPDRRARVVLGEKAELPRLDGYDLIILNWDVANGDYAYLADETLEFFKNRGREELKRWASKGSRIIVEIQSAAGFPMQSLYDGLLGQDEVTVSPYGLVDSHEDAQSVVALNTCRLGHPILASLSDPVRLVATKYQAFRHNVFPNFDQKRESSYARYPAPLAWGNFIAWRKGWYPLLLRVAEDASGKTRMPVALIKRVGDAGGEIVATTMRIANAANDDLLDAMCRVDQERRSQTLTFYKQAERRRVVTRAAMIFGAWLVGIILIVPAGNFAADQFKLTLPQVLEAVDSNNMLLSLFAKNFPLAEFTGIAMVLTLLALSRRWWRQRDRL